MIFHFNLLKQEHEPVDFKLSLGGGEWENFMSIHQSFIKVGLFASVSLFAFAPTVYANGCEPNRIGGSGADTITCTGSQASGTAGIVRANEGDDTIIVTDANSAGVNWDVEGDEGNDTITVTNSIVNDLRADAASGSGENTTDGNDVVTFTNSTLTEQLYLAGGNDTLSATDSTINDLFIGSGNDVIVLNNSTVDTFGSSRGGNETLTLTNGSLIDSSVNIADGADTVLLDNSTIDGSLAVGNNTADDGDDSVTVRNGAVVDGNITFGDGNNTLLVDNGTVGAISFGDGNDTVSILNNATVGGDVVTNDGNDTVLVDNASFGNGDQIRTGDGNDMITILNSDNTDNNVDATAGSGDDIIVVRNSVVNDVRGDGLSTSNADGDDTITITNSTVEEQIWSAGGDDVVTLNNVMLLNDGSTNGASLSTGTGDDVVNLSGGTINGFINLGDDEDTIVLNGGTTFNTSSTNSLVAGSGSDNVTINGGIYEGISMNSGENDFDIVDELVINDGTFNGIIHLGGGSDLVTVNGGNLTQGIGIVGQGFQQETIVINGGTVGTNPSNGHSIFTGEDEDQVGIFGGDVQDFISLAGGDDLLVIDGGADEYTSAETQVFNANGFLENANNPHDPTTNDLDHSITGSALVATPTEFLGGSGDDVAEIFDLVDTENLDFESWNDVNLYGLSVTLADDAAGEQSQSIDYLRLLRGSTLTQTSGRLDIVAEGGAMGGTSTLIVDGTSRVTMQDGAVDDLIAVQTFAPQAGSLLAVDVDTVTEGLDLQDSDYIIGGTHTPEAGAIVNVAVVNNVGSTSQRGSRRIVDSNAASVEAPGLGDRPNASATYVLQNDPSFGARQFWLQDDANGGVYLVWTTPVSPVTMAAILGGAASGAALNPDGTLDLTDPNLMVDPNAKGAGLDTLAAANTSSFIADSINGNSGRASLDCNTGRRDWNLWGNLGAETGEYGQSEMDTGYAAIGAEKDISSVANAECGRYKAGVFAFTSHSEIEHPLLGNDKEPNSYGLGAYLRGATESNFYGSVMGYIGETDYNGVNAVLESRFEYDSSDWGARLDVGKLIPLNDRGNLDADITGYVGITSSSADSFADSNDFVTSSIDNDGLNYGASVGLNKHYENNQTIFGRVGVDFNDIESELVAYTIPVNSEPSYTLGRVEAGYENTTENGRGTLRLSGIARFGSESEAYGARLMGIVRF